MIDNYVDANTVVETLAVVLQYRTPTTQSYPGELCVLLEQRPKESDPHRWFLPGGLLGTTEDLTASIHRHLAQKLRIVAAHTEQLGMYAEPSRRISTQHRPARVVSGSFLALLNQDTATDVPDDSAWHPISGLDDLDWAFDHYTMVSDALKRLAGKLSYTNIAFALAPETFPISLLRDIYTAGMGYPVDATNLLRVLSRRSVIAATGSLAAPPSKRGGRPPALYRFVDNQVRVTDEFAAFKPPA